MRRLLIFGKAKKVFDKIECLAKRQPDMPVTLYSGKTVFNLK